MKYEASYFRAKGFRISRICYSECFHMKTSKWPFLMENGHFRPLNQMVLLQIFETEIKMIHFIRKCKFWVPKMFFADLRPFFEASENCSSLISSFLRTLLVWNYRTSYLHFHIPRYDSYCNIFAMWWIKATLYRLEQWVLRDCFSSTELV